MNILNYQNNKVFMSILTTDDYLPGLLVLNHSLKLVKSEYPLHVLLTPNISKKTISILSKNLISYSVIIKEIINPTNIYKNHRWYSTYSKLAIFGQEQYKKIVYLDADMLILRNIDELFQCKHMSATDDESILPRKKDPRHLNLNSGLIVIEPSYVLYRDMIKKIGIIKNLKLLDNNTERPVNGSDQDFINAYYPEWPKQKELHLDRKYNIFNYHIDEYNKLFGFSIENGTRPISVIHYASYLKPWNITEQEFNALKNDFTKKMEFLCIEIWIESYKKLCNIK